MDLKHFQQLLAIQEEGSISAAADQLGLAQPALSRSIQRLEKELGQPLFDRSKNRVEFNQAGRIALSYAQRITAELEALTHDLEALHKALRTLKIGSCAPAPAWEVTRQALALSPSLLLESELTPENKLLDGLLQGKYQLVISSSPLAHQPGILSKPLMTEKLEVSLPQAHPLAQQATLDFAQLDGLAFLLLEEVGIWLDICQQALPHSQLILQKDANILRQLLASSDLPGFTSNLASNQLPGRVSIPLSSQEASQTFFINILDSVRSKEQAAQIYQALPEASRNMQE